MNCPKLHLCLLGVALLTGCDKDPAPSPTPSATTATKALSVLARTKEPDTKGLSPSTNFYAIVNLPTEADQKMALDAMVTEFKRATSANPKSKPVIRAIDDMLGRANDAGLCDVAQGELRSITAGVTLPSSLQEIQSLEGADIDFAIILRGKFDPKRTKAFCEAEGVKGTLIDGQPAWDLNSIITKLNPKAKPSKTEPGKEEWFAYADDATLVIGNRNSLRKSLNAFKGQSPSLRPAHLKAVEAFGDWNVYLCFANPGLINDSFRQETAGNQASRKLLAAMPHDQVVLLAGLHASDASTALILANQTTQENIQYTASASQSLLPKLIEAYVDVIGQAIESGR